LLIGVLLRVVPDKFVLVQPATPVDKGNTQHFSTSRHGRVCARATIQVLNALAVFLDDNVRKQKYALLRVRGGLAEPDVSGWSWSWSRSLSRWCGRFQNGYGRNSDCGYTLRSGNRCEGIQDALGTLSGTWVRLTFLLLQIAENGNMRGRTGLANRGQ
jgi:hypothetical protein